MNLMYAAFDCLPFSFSPSKFRDMRNDLRQDLDVTLSIFDIVLLLKLEF